MIASSKEQLDFARLNRQINGLLSRLSPSAAIITQPFVKKLLEAYQTGDIYITLSSDDIKTLHIAEALVGTPDRPAPLIIENNRLYIARLWSAEQKVAAGLLNRANITDTVDTECIASIINQCCEQASFYQKKAIALALRQHLLVLSGDPGTGKSHIAINIATALASLATLQHKKTALMALVAPNKKAVLRLNHLLNEVRKENRLPDNVLDLLPEKAITVNELIGFSYDKATPRYHHDNPLLLNTLIIDEAHMIDIEHMARINDALLADTRLILLGDPSQLITKNHSNILTELYHTPCYQPSTLAWLAKITGQTETLDDHPEDRLSDCIICLEKDNALSIEPSISELSKTILRGDTKNALSQLHNPSISNINGVLPTEKLADTVCQMRCSYFETAAKGDPETAFAAFFHTMLLVTSWGALHTTNQQQERLLEKSGIKPPDEAWYIGRPIILGSLHGIKGISAGDIGLTLPTENGLRVFFENADGKTYQRLHPDYLPSCHTALSLNLFKSHALTFDHVCLLLPDNENTELDRYWLSFALARATHSFAFYGACDNSLIEPLSRTSTWDTTLYWRLTKNHIKI